MMQDMPLAEAQTRYTYLLRTVVETKHKPGNKNYAGRRTTAEDVRCLIVFRTSAKVRLVV